MICSHDGRGSKLLSTPFDAYYGITEIIPLWCHVYFRLVTSFCVGLILEIVCHLAEGTQRSFALLFTIISSQTTLSNYAWALSLIPLTGRILEELENASG